MDLEQLRLQQVEDKSEDLMELCQQLMTKKKKRCRVVTSFKNIKEHLN